MKSLAVISAVAGALAVPANVTAATFFIFDRPNATPNDRVMVRKGGTPADFTVGQRAKPLQRPIRLYLLPTRLIGDVHSRFDSRLAFIGSLAPDRRGRGVFALSVPPLDAGAYTVAYWCPGCARHSRGRTFYVQDTRQFAEPYRSKALLRVAATTECPVTIPNGSTPPGLRRATAYHGNDALWTAISPDGTLVAEPDQWPQGPPGSTGTKLFWWAAGVDGALAVRGERLDAPSQPLIVHQVNRGSEAGFRGTATWATPVSFPTDGCWRIRARVKDVTLLYVARVVGRGGE